VDVNRQTCENSAVTLSPPRTRAFTLIELLVVIAIIAVLMGLAFPVFQNVQNSAKKTQAKNDAIQVVTAINAFYTEYGQYPAGASTGADWRSDQDQDRRNLFDTLRAPFDEAPQRNPRKISFLQVQAARDQTNPRSGIANNGIFYDPWGSPYWIAMDNTYDGRVPNPYDANTGAGYAQLNVGAIVWSCGRDQKGPTGGPKGQGTKDFRKSDDVISWQ
jgi:prepilin-type N-terminal cleavage/methylation domain-containing protein